MSTAHVSPELACRMCQTHLHAGDGVSEGAGDEVGCETEHGTRQGCGPYPQIRCRRVQTERTVSLIYSMSCHSVTVSILTLTPLCSLSVELRAYNPPSLPVSTFLGCSSGFEEFLCRRYIPVHTSGSHLPAASWPSSIILDSICELGGLFADISFHLCVLVELTVHLRC